MSKHRPKKRVCGVLLTTALLCLAIPQRLLGDPSTFYNVILPEGADPWVIRHSDGYYYMTVTTGVNVTLWRSRSLTGLGAGQRKTAWTPPPTGAVTKDLWAPELHHVNGRWYIYVAADDGRWKQHRMHVLENDNADPFQGEFVLKGKVFDPHADRWAIDGTLFSVKGRLFFVWSGWEGTENVRQNLYIAPMSNPITLGGPRVEISRPQFAWEKAGSDPEHQLPEVNEGPVVLVRADRVVIVYSAGGSWTNDYCLGMLTAQLDGDLLSPTTWKKREEPVFHRARGVIGPGHCSVVTSPDGAEDWLVYHAARFPGAGWKRLVRAQPFSWGTDGLPNLGVPRDPNVPIPLPAGDPPHVRYEAETARLSGEARTLSRADASGRAAVGSIATPGSFAEFHITATTVGPHIIAVRFSNMTDGTRRASHTITVNETATGALSYPYSGRDNWSNAFLSVDLRKGENTVRFTQGSWFAEIDCIDVFVDRN